ncbi:hypothetical protein BLOT_015838 [Blomia tropicalis]|nr:hypothetical protein BLOT_015838 [Blomia tropicalis]
MNFILFYTYYLSFKQRINGDNNNRIVKLNSAITAFMLVRVLYLFMTVDNQVNNRLFSAISFDSFVFTYSFVSILVITIGRTQLMIMIIKLKQTYQLIVKCKKQIDRTGSIFLFINVLLQFIGIFSAHYSLVHFAKYYHRSGPLLINRMVRYRNRKNCQHTRLKLLLIIETVHTIKRYGVTYGSFELVTMMSFTKLGELKSALKLKYQ